METAESDDGAALLTHHWNYESASGSKDSTTATNGMAAPIVSATYYTNGGDGKTGDANNSAKRHAAEWSVEDGRGVATRRAANDPRDRYPNAEWSDVTSGGRDVAVATGDRRKDGDFNDDENFQFLMSLLPYLRDVPKHRKLMVRHRLQKVFMDEQDKYYAGSAQHCAPTVQPHATIPSRPPPPYTDRNRNEFNVPATPQNLVASDDQQDYSAVRLTRHYRGYRGLDLDAVAAAAAAAAVPEPVDRSVTWTTVQ